MRIRFSLLVLCFFAVLLLQAAGLVGVARADAIPRDAYRFERGLIANARAVWGVDAPVATFAAQIHQESRWRPQAKSRFAEGLAQFTPATADWIAGAYADVGNAAPFNPAWAMRALVRYDRVLWNGVSAATDCDRMAMALAGYNGGIGHIATEKKATAAAGQNPARWWGNVESHCLRAAWACKENRGYPRNILLRWQPLYVAASWGAGVDCSHIEETK